MKPTLPAHFPDTCVPGRRRFLTSLAALAAGACLPARAAALTVGVTLHPYYSFVANIVGDHARVLPLIDAGFNPHAYEPRAEDIKRINQMSVVVLNAIGHDDFAKRMIAASDKPQLPTINANDYEIGRASCRERV